MFGTEIQLFINAQTINSNKYSTTLLGKIRQLHATNLILSFLSQPVYFFQSQRKRRSMVLKSCFTTSGASSWNASRNSGVSLATLRRDIATSRRTHGPMCNRQLANVPELLKEPPRLREAASTLLKSRNFQNGQSRANDRRNNIETPPYFLVFTVSWKFYDWTIDSCCRSIENVCYVSETSKEANLWRKWCEKEKEIIERCFVRFLSFLIPCYVITYLLYYFLLHTIVFLSFYILYVKFMFLLCIKLFYIVII